MCVFNGFFMRLGPDFSRFGHKDIYCRVRNKIVFGLDKIQNWTKLFSDSHMLFCFFYFFFFSKFL